MQMSLSFRNQLSNGFWVAAVFCFFSGLAGLPQSSSMAQQTPEQEIPKPKPEQTLISSVRQLTLDGRRSGEGYYNLSGSKMVFQSEREKGNPFYQIYWVDFETGDSQRVSPGHGKTTCAWIHPNDQEVLFASTQFDPAALKKQKAELDFRASGKQRRYSWDYDPAFDLVMWNSDTEKYRRLTSEVGYDAEACVSEDGKKIVFASNRLAYSRDLNEEEKEILKINPSYFIDLYLMNSDGSGLERLTKSKGYDGGPFFSADGKSVCWRRFNKDGTIAEIMTMDLATRKEKQLTRMNVMSWAPFFHPSGKYLIFTTNKLGFANFELYLVAADGKGEPVRATYRKGFDGLPTFTPDGKKLSWTSNLTSKKQSQIFLADWDHEKAMKLLGLDKASSSTDPSVQKAKEIGKDLFAQLDASINEQDLLRHVDYLCRKELAGRDTGSLGERMATAYVASIFDSLGLKPAGDNGTWFQKFRYPAGVKLGKGNSLKDGQRSFELGKDWQPVSFSASGKIEPGNVVFAGYGMQVDQTEGFQPYDSFVHLICKDKWVLVFRYMPEDVSPKRRQTLARFQALQRKASVARSLGAKGLIVVSGPRTKVRSQLIPLSKSGSMQGSSLPIISVTNEVAESWMKTANKDLGKLQQKLDRGDLMMGFELPKVTLDASIDVKQIYGTGRNVLGRLGSGKKAKAWDETVVVGAHIDHLGQGPSKSSLSGNVDKMATHFGADDNASGVAAMLEMAQALTDQAKRGKLKLKRDIVFAGWSGEELGLIGSLHFTNKLKKQLDTQNPGRKEKGIYPAVSANLNMDMVGRLRKSLILQGIGSSNRWKSEIEKRNLPVGLSLTLQNDCDLPTDASAFYRNGVPILSAFTGSHLDYHKPTDTPDKLNYPGTVRVTKLFSLIARGLLTSKEIPPFQSYNKAEGGGKVRAVLRAYLGTIPEYGAGDIKGLLLSGVTKGAPAAIAGMKGGDVVVELAGKKIENVYDYTYAIEALKVGQKTTVVVIREGKRLKLNLIPGSRD